MSNHEHRREHERQEGRRDDQARLRELEDELAAAERTIERLQGGENVPVSKEGTAGGRALKRAGHDPSHKTEKWLGAPAILRLSRRFDGALPRDRFEAVVERVRELTHEPGIVEVRDDGIVWGSSTERHPSQTHLMVRVTIDEKRGVTNLTVTDRLGALIGRLFGAFGTIVGAGGLAGPVAASIAFPAFAPLFVFGWLGGVFGTTRVLYRRLAASRAKRLHEIFGAIVLEIEPYTNNKKR